MESMWKIEGKKERKKERRRGGNGKKKEMKEKKSDCFCNLGFWPLEGGDVQLLLF